MKQTTLFKQKRIKLLDNALLIEDKILVIADLHIGYEESVVEKGIFLRMQVHEIITRLNKIFDKINFLKRMHQEVMSEIVNKKK